MVRAVVGEGKAVQEEEVKLQGVGTLGFVKQVGFKPGV